MGRWVIPLERAAKQDISVVGRKAAALGSTLEAGFPVPPGVCITTHSFSQALAPYLSQVQAIQANRQLSDPAGAQAAAGQIAALTSGLALPEPVIAALDQAITGAPWLAEGPLAVRSSASDEDGNGHSFAGQYLSRLGVRGWESLHAAILDCWRAFYSANALAARAAIADAGAVPGMAILIQPAVDTECAGACFTLDPVDQERDRMVVTSGWGLGSGVADGSIQADTAWLRRSSQSWAAWCSTKEPSASTLPPPRASMACRLSSKPARPRGASPTAPGSRSMALRGLSKLSIPKP